MKNDSDDIRKGLLAWALEMAGPIKAAIDEGHPIHMLADHIKSYKDTEAFMAAFNDETFGRCKEMFKVGPEYWRKVPELRAKWYSEGVAGLHGEGGLNQEQVKAVMDALSELGYDKDRKPEQVQEIKRGLTKALQIGKLTPQIVNSAWGSGKTVTITVIAFALSKLMPEAPILIALLNEAEAERMAESFEQQKLKVRKCLKYEDFGKAAFGAITITIHKALAQFVYYGHSDELSQFYAFIDEVDRFSELSPLGFKGSKDVMKLVEFFYGTSADELTPEDKVPNGLDCPPETEFIKVGKRSKNVKVIKITESGIKLYKKLGTLAKDKKLLLCVKDKGNMIAWKDLMVKHGKIDKERIITFDPETAHH